jgi:hypothetical protein
MDEEAPLMMNHEATPLVVAGWSSQRPVRPLPGMKMRAHTISTVHGRLLFESCNVKEALTGARRNKGSYPSCVNFQVRGSAEATILSSTEVRACTDCPFLADASSHLSFRASCRSPLADHLLLITSC